MNRNLTLVMSGFLMLFFAQWVSGIVLHWFYFNEAFSFERWLESAVPHLVAISAISFVLAHFLCFIPRLSLTQKVTWGLGLIFFGGIHSLSRGATVFWGIQFNWIHLTTLLIYQFFLFGSMALILNSAFRGLQETSVRFSKKSLR